MGDEEDEVPERQDAEVSATPGSLTLGGGVATISGSSFTGSTTSGDQTITLADAKVQIEVETPAHKREIERQRLEREHEKEKRQEEENYKDRHYQRVRENWTFAVVVGLIIAGLVGSFLVAVLSDDPVQQVWAQGLTTTIAGVVGGAFAGYLIGGRKQ